MKLFFCRSCNRQNRRRALFSRIDSWVTEHQDLARQLVEMIEAEAEKLAYIKKRMDEILEKAA